MSRPLDDYQPVDERIHQFWSDCENGAIVPELIYAEDGVYRFRVEVFTDKDDLHPIAVGYAQEVEGKGGPVNRQGFTLENCETSAIGRALANAGYSPRGLRPSREEMSKVRPPSTEDTLLSPPAGETSGSTSKGPVLSTVPDLDPDATALQLGALLQQADTDLWAWKYNALQKNTKNLFLLMEQLGLWRHDALEKALKKHDMDMRAPHDELAPFAEKAFVAARHDFYPEKEEG